MNRPAIGCAAIALVLSIPAPAKSPSQNNESKDEKEVQSFVLTTGFLDKMIAIQEEAARLEQTHPELKKEGEAAGRRERRKNGESIDGMVKTIESVPPLANLIKAQGLTVRQYTVGLLALIPASMYVAFKKWNPDTKLPEGLSRANVAFVETHQAALEKFGESMKATKGDQKQKTAAPVQEEEKTEEK